MILCLGTTPAIGRVMVFEEVRRGGVNRAARVTEVAAGKAINAAKVAHRLGGSVLATGFAGGRRGGQLREVLDLLGVAHELIEVRAETRLCVTVIDRTAPSHTELVEESGTVESQDVDRLLERLAALLPSATLLTLCGTLAPGVPEDFYARCVRLAAAAGVGAIVDAKGPALELAVREGPLLVKPNLAELEQTLGASVQGEGELRAAMRRLARTGARRVVVTLGKAGAAAFDGHRFLRVIPPEIQAVSSIGSGDALCGAMAVGLADGLDLTDALILGVACGTANALTEEAGEIDTTRVEGLRAKTLVRLIAPRAGRAIPPGT
jgi:tagatose 6-phosphate kinase